MNLAVFVLTLFHTLFVVLVTVLAGLWLASLEKKGSIVEIFCIAIFGGLSTIAIIGQVIFYSTDTFGNSLYGIFAFIGVGIISAVWKFRVRRGDWLVRWNGVGFALSVLVAGFIFTNFSFLNQGVEDYAASRNPDMWYYAAVSKSITDDGEQFVPFSEGLDAVTQFLLAKTDILKSFAIADDPEKLEIRNVLIEKYIKEQYYYYPGKISLLFGVVTRNANDFFVSFFSSMMNFSAGVIYNLIQTLYAILGPLAALWLTHVFGFRRRTQILAVALSSFSSIIYSCIYIQWPATTTGIPLIIFWLGYFYKHLKEPTWRSGFSVAFFGVSLFAIYPEGIVIAGIPFLALLLQTLKEKWQIVAQSFKISVFWFLGILLSIGYPAFILMLLRASRVTGKFTVMPGPEYTLTPNFFYKMYVQPEWIHRVNDIVGMNFLHLYEIIAGSSVSLCFLVGPWFLKGHQRILTASVSVGFVFLYSYLFVIKSTYSLNKLVHFYPIFFAILLACIWEHLVFKKEFLTKAIAHMLLFFFLSLNIYSQGVLAGIEFANYTKPYLPDVHIPHKEFLALSKLGEPIEANEKLMLVLPDRTSQLWATHFISQPLVMPDGIGYLDSYVKSALEREPDRYLHGYRYMLIPGKSYPTVEDFSYFGPAQWHNDIFALVPRSFVYYLSDDTPMSNYSDRYFYELERDVSGETFRWVNYGLRAEFINADNFRSQKYSVRFDCEPVGGATVNLDLRIGGKSLRQFKLEKRAIMHAEELALPSPSGFIELSNTDPKPFVFPRDVKNVTFRCFKFQFFEDGKLPSYFPSPLVTNDQGDIDLEKSVLWGYFPDRWVQPEVVFTLPLNLSAGAMTISGVLPQLLPQGIEVEVSIDNVSIGSVNLAAGKFALRIDVERDWGGKSIKLAFNLSAELPKPDFRTVSAQIHSIRLSTEEGTL